MLQRLSLVTLGVDDLDRARRFYCDGLGWTASSASTDEVIFLDAGGVVLGLYPRHKLAEDAGLPGEPTSGFGGIALAHNVAVREQVDVVLETARRAGATVLKPATEAFWGGYTGYFADPDGHPWEVAFNPHWPLDELGRIRLPE